MRSEAKAMSGAMAYHGGLAAERAVERHYQEAGHLIAARRWRGTAGEIDLVARGEDGIIFIEVKKSRSFAQAAERLTQRQMNRIWSSASEFLAGEPCGLDSTTRFDVALVDQAGRIEIIENAFWH